MDFDYTRRFDAGKGQLDNIFNHRLNTENRRAFFSIVSVTRGGRGIMTDEHVGAAPVALTPEVVAFLQREGVEVEAAAGEVLARRGETGVAFWALLEGAVEVRLTGEDGVHLPLSRMGAGSTFGEMSLITGDPISADVVALTPVRLLCYPAGRFACALGE